jgi:hypothetical protein
MLLGLLGCGGGDLPVDGDDNQYTLEFTVEKNIDDQADYLYVRFLRNGITISNGYVAVIGDTEVDTIYANGLSASICLDPIVYPKDHWDFGEVLTITAVDDSTLFRYEDAIAIPDSFEIDNFIPANHLWQNGNVLIDWTGADGVTAFLVSMTGSIPGSPANGFAARDDLGLRSMTITPDAFFDAVTDTIVPDLYNVHVLGYARNFVRRACAEYLSPSIGYDDPIDDVQIDGAISAIVVSKRDTIRVEPLL